MKTAAWLILLATSALAQPIDLAGPWKLNPTDDPRSAQPGIDDNGWPSITLPQRIRGRSGIFWLRRTVPGPLQTTDLAVTVGLVSESYELYVNGVRIGDTGDIGTSNPRFFQARRFPVPPGLIREGSSVVVALRIWRVNLSWGALTNGIEDEGPYLITSPMHAVAEVSAAQKSMRLAITPGLIITISQFVIGLFLLVLWFSERDRREHLFFAVFLILSSLIFLLAIWSVYAGGSFFWHRYVYRPLSAVVMFSLLQFTTHVLRVRSLPSGIMAGAAILCAFEFVWDMGNYLHPPLALVAWQCLRALRAARGESRVFTIAILVNVAALINNTLPIEMRLFRRNLDFGDMTLAVTNLLQLLFAAAVMILLLRRLAADRREKLRLAAEVEAARVVQQLLLSQPTALTGAYAVEAVYEPAQHVGGDFFWTRTDPDGALLVMVGDVSGKGLKAAMLVALIMGVLRQRPERQPERLLALLNQALAGEMHGGFVTACCMRADPGGEVSVANAGHLTPYSDGRECAVESGLPLGVVENVEYAATLLQLQPGQQLTFVSDGVVEATNAKGELFGFERTREICNKPAQQIATAAQAWGQNDDITIVTVRRRA